MADCRFQSGTVSLAVPKKRIRFRSKLQAMEQSADQQRDFDAFVVPAIGETSTQSSFTTKHTKYTKMGAENCLFRFS
jgi:hypothetical protein